MYLLDRPRRTVIIIGVIMAAIMALVGGALIMSQRPLGEDRCLYDYTIVLTRLEGLPWRDINLSAQDLASHPYVGRVLAAYQNPASSPLAVMRNETLYYSVPMRDDVAVTETNDFLLARWGAANYPMILTAGNGRYYAWELMASDPGYFGPCP